MNAVETFEQFLVNDSAQISIWKFILNLFITGILSYLLGLLYRRFGNSLSNRHGFSRNFVLLSITTMIIISIVKSSLALSLGLVGALSIVRFRAAIKEPEELAYLFLNIAIGLGLGADQKMATLIGFMFIAAYLLGKNLLYQKASHENENLIIIVRARKPTKDMLNEILEIVKKYCDRVNLKRFDENSDMLEVSFLVEAISFAEINSAKIELNEKYSDLVISFIDNKFNH